MADIKKFSYPPVTEKNREQIVVCPLCRKRMYYYALQKHLAYPPQTDFKECSEELHNIILFRNSIYR